MCQPQDRRIDTHTAARSRLRLPDPRIQLQKKKTATCQETVPRYTPSRHTHSRNNNRSKCFIIKGRCLCFKVRQCIAWDRAVYSKNDKCVNIQKICLYLSLLQRRWRCCNDATFILFALALQQTTTRDFLGGSVTKNKAKSSVTFLLDSASSVSVSISSSGSGSGSGSPAVS